MMLFIAALVGANTVICRYLNAIYARHNGLSMSTLANYVTGLATALLALLVLGDPSPIQPVESLTFRTVTMFLGGAVGVGLVQISIHITPRLPAFLATLLIFLSQLGSGLLIDFWMTGAFSIGKVVGGALVLMGLSHYAWVGKRSQVPDKAR
ncbi:MAG: DMT family transporter [Candidatus Limiplasma sp.]|nr:DMT family transporter [Candidatus Limiplasma sp.]